jgi:hypothetical protein
MSTFGKGLIASVKQAAAHARGRKVRGVRVAKVQTVHPKLVKCAVRMSKHKRHGD